MEAGVAVAVVGVVLGLAGVLSLIAMREGVEFKFEIKALWFKLSIRIRSSKKRQGS